MKRPNVLLIYTDQQRWDTIRAAGQHHIKTPNLDALAARGVLFDNTYCNSPVCMPSRASMLSGQYPTSTSVIFNGIEMPTHIPCIQHYLKPYGYHTANIGKLHFCNHASYGRDHREPYPDYGFDTQIISDEPGCYDDAYIKWVAMQDPDAVENCRCDTPPAWSGKSIKGQPRTGLSPYVFKDSEHLTHSAFVADETVDFLRHHQKEPFFCVAGFYAPHDPFNPPATFLDQYDPDSLPLPFFNDGENRKEIPNEQWQKIKAHYYALISHVDDQVGRILRELTSLKLEENTLVIFTSDHGEHLGDHGRTGKCNPWDSSARVPLIMSHPSFKASSNLRSEIIEHVDLVPTILDCCGIQAPPALQGRSFRPLLQGRAYEPRTSAFMEMRIPDGSGFKAVRTKNYLYAVHANDEEELYEIASDPNQLTNLAYEEKHQAPLNEMRKELMRRWFDVDRKDLRRTGAY